MEYYKEGNTNMIIAVASGKGGTGKTTISLSLGRYIAESASESGKDVSILDCDVEEPNVNLFLRAPIEKTEKVYRLIPDVNDEACNGCGKCEEICAYSAIVLVKGKPLVFPDMCHSCGGCSLVCPKKAITENKKETGVLETGFKDRINYAGGRLNIGEPMSPPLIKAVKGTSSNGDVRILDCPPGTSCPVVESVRGCDFLLLVTEPTPFGLNDLKLAVNMARALGLRYGVVINKYGSGDDRVDKYCAEENIPVIVRLPFEKDIAERYSRGEFIDYMLERHAAELGDIYRYALKTCAEKR